MNDIPEERQRRAAVEGQAEACRECCVRLVWQGAGGGDVAGPTRLPRAWERSKRWSGVATAAEKGEGALMHSAAPLHSAAPPDSATPLHSAAQLHTSAQLHSASPPHTAASFHLAAPLHSAVPLHSASPPHTAASLHSSTPPRLKK